MDETSLYYFNDIKLNIPEFPGGASGKESACQSKRCKRRGFDPGFGRFPGVGNGNLLQHSCLEHFMEKGARKVIVHGVTKSQTGLSTCSLIISNKDILRKL